MKLKADVIKWQHFTRKGDAIFRSLGREIIISTLSVATLTFAAPLDAHAQTVTGHLQSQESVQEDTLPVLEVTATRLPLPMEQAARVVNVISREEIQSLPVQSVNDVLKYASTVDVRQRGAFGIQTDLSINGGTHDQIVILLNGVNISSPHTRKTKRLYEMTNESISGCSLYSKIGDKKIFYVSIGDESVISLQEKTLIIVLKIQKNLI